MTINSDAPSPDSRGPGQRGTFGAGLDSIMRMSSTRLNYWLELVIDLVAGVTLVAAGLWRHLGHPWSAFAIILTGLLAFSFVEYFFHRWLFHSGLPLFAQGHDAHHQRPEGYDSLPFFLPPAVLLTAFGLFVLVMPTSAAMLLSGSMALGYVAYGLSHFIIHHRRFRIPMLRRWAARHHIHHHHPDANFGVTTSLWDVLLGTRYVSRGQRA